MFVQYKIEIRLRNVVVTHRLIVDYTEKHNHSVHH